MCLFSLQKFGDYLMDKIIVSPSILSADFANLERDIKKVENAGADWIHVDVMDGHFVPNITIGIPVVSSLRKVTNLLLDVHLMIENPEKYVEAFAKAGADIITFHYEACSNKDEIISIAKYLNENRVRVGIAVNPDTKIEEIFDVLPYVHMVLVMSVVPGKGGQKFIPETLDKVELLRKYCEENDLDMDIEVDGGINDETGKEAVEAGANILVSGNYVLNADDYKEAINNLKNL